MICTDCMVSMVEKKPLIQLRKDVVTYQCPQCGMKRRMKKLGTVHSESLGQGTVWVDIKE
jgi:predicted RNA-binding Zn-ribbon protein involved in translation (DUF1610 family)